MNKTNIEVCPFCGEAPKLKIDKIPKMIGSPQPQKYLYYYTCTCGKVTASSANDCVMTSQEAIDYAGYLWNMACQRNKPAELAAEQPAPVKTVDSLGSFTSAILEAVQAKAEPEPEPVVEPTVETEAPTETEAPVESESTREVEQPEAVAEPEAEVTDEADSCEEDPEMPEAPKQSNPMLATLDDILGTTPKPRKKSTKKS